MTATTPKPNTAAKAQRLQTFSMPDVGEGLTEAEVLSWHVAVGETLTVNQVMVEIETAKAAVGSGGAGESVAAAGSGPDAGARRCRREVAAVADV